MSDVQTHNPFGGSFEIPEANIAEFQCDGCTLLRGLCNSEEIAGVRSLIAETVAERSRGIPDLSERDTYGRAFLQIENLWQSVPAARAFSLSPRFGEVAARLMGTDAVRLYHDQALFKEPSGGPTPWHQDQGYWPLRGWGPLTMWMALVDLDEEMGGSMSFARGSCHMDLPDFAISDASQLQIQHLVDSGQLEATHYGPLAAGDATFHAGWELHRARANPTSKMREIMTIIFIPDGMTIAEPENIRQANDLAHWLPGCRPGELAASPLNPVVFNRHDASKLRGENNSGQQGR